MVVNLPAVVVVVAGVKLIVSSNEERGKLVKLMIAFFILLTLFIIVSEFASAYSYYINFVVGTNKDE